MRPYSPRNSPNAVFLGLMTLSVALLMIRPQYKAWMQGVLQPLSWFESLASGVGRGVRHVAESWSAPPAEDPARLRARIDELERQVGTQSIQISELQAALAEVSGLRQVLGDEGLRIIPAGVTGGAASIAREFIDISRGARHGVEVGDWVVAGRTVDDSTEESAAQKLSHFWLLGQVASVQPYVSRVRLCSDPASPALRVSAAKALPDGRWLKADKPCKLQGFGNGRMRILSATANYQAEGYSAVLAEIDLAGAASLPLGRIEDARVLPESALHFNIDVSAWCDVRGIASVFVIASPAK